MGRRQAVRQRTLTPSFGCSNHFAPATKRDIPCGISFFVILWVKDESPALRVFARGGEIDNGVFMSSPLETLL